MSNGIKPDFEDLAKDNYTPHVSKKRKKEIKKELKQTSSTSRYIKAIQEAIKKNPQLLRLEPTTVTPKIHRDEMIRTVIDSVIRASDCYMQDL